MEEYVMANYITPILKVDLNGKTYIYEEELYNYNLNYNEKLFIQRLLNARNIDIRKKELENNGEITEKDRTTKANDYHYGAIESNGMAHLDKPKIATVDYNAGELVFASFEKLEEFLEHDFLPNHIQMKVNRAPEKGKPFASVQLNKLVDLRLSEVEMKHAIDYLQKNGIRVGGLSQDLDSEFENYDYISTYKHIVLPEITSNKPIEELYNDFYELRIIDPNSQYVSLLRQHLILLNLKLVPYIAYRIAYFHGIEQEILESYGYEGLIYAIDNYNPNLTGSFASYAIPCIRGFINNNIPLLKNIPRNLYYPFQRAKLAVEREWMKPFNPNDFEMLDEILDLMGEVSGFAGRSRDNLRKAILLNSESFDEMAEDENLSDEISEVQFDLEEIVEQKELRGELEKVLETLTPRECMVLKLRYGFVTGRPMELDEVAKEFNVTRERIRQIEAKALRKMRHPSRAKFLKGFIR